ASQQVEEEYCLGRRTVAARQGATRQELKDSKLDVFTGAFISKLITYFITLTTAATLFAHGHRQIETAKDAAAALNPIAGPAAYWLFALGVIGTGLLAIPTLAGSSAYAVAEALRWRASLEEKPSLAPKFYTVLAISMLLGMSLIYLHFNVVQMLFWASIFNGILAPPSIALVVLLTSNPHVMAGRVNSKSLQALGWISVALTAATAMALLVSFIH
ncbi:MAG: natural resistance-associated macrophage protein, partial [Candidatus Sulfotelmatobacter sp.]|nr:natural resistance-associated macrophage protein [Candidatus Sulfotelmatobacter sp.]